MVAQAFGAADMVPLSGGEMTGTLTLAGDPPLTIPGGASDGKVWTSDAEGNGSWVTPSGGSGIGVTVSGTPSNGEVLTATSSTTADWQAPAVIDGVTVSGTPTAGEVLTATSPSAADWQSPAATTLDGVTVTGTPAKGQALVATSGSGAIWQGVSGARPEWFGVIGAGSDDIAINAAIAAVNAGTVPGPVCLTQAYSIASTITAMPGVNIVGTGQGNRQVTPNVFTGGVIQPSSSFAASTPLITIGKSVANGGNPNTNPNGMTLFGICLNGYTAGGGDVSGCIGILASDTTDLHLDQCFLANFDRTGGAGYCVVLTSATAGNGYGFQMQDSQVSDSAYGLFTSGAGVTDMRISGNLFHSCTYGATHGGAYAPASTSGGGGGLQSSGNHYAYPAAPSGSYHLLMGSAAGDSMISVEYFDKSGITNVPVQLATSKLVLTSCHFLAETGCTAASLVSCSSANQELSFSDNQMNGNASSVVALVQFTNGGITTALNGGCYGNNVIYNAPDATAVLVGSGGAPITSVNPAATVTGGVICDPSGA
jgi:hypothetical protein